MSYSWSLSSKPETSTTTLSNATEQQAQLFIDVPGTYIVQLIVSDPLYQSAPATVALSTNYLPPVANPGSDQSVLMGATVTLDGSGSTSTTTYPTTYKWLMTSRPEGSAAQLSGTGPHPTFVADVAGAYVIQLIVNDGVQDSAPVSAVVTAGDAPLQARPNRRRR